MEGKSAAPLSAETIEKLSALRGAEPCYLFARRLGLSTETTGRALAGLPLYRGTRTLVEFRLKELSAGNEASLEGAATAA